MTGVSRGTEPGEVTIGECGCGLFSDIGSTVDTGGSVGGLTMDFEEELGLDNGTDTLADGNCEFSEVSVKNDTK